MQLYQKTHGLEKGLPYHTFKAYVCTIKPHGAFVYLDVFRRSPKGSKYPIFEVSGSKNHTLSWTPKVCKIIAQSHQK